MWKGIYLLFGSDVQKHEKNGDANRFMKREYQDYLLLNVVGIKLNSLLCNENQAKSAWGLYIFCLRWAVSDVE